MDRYQHKRNTPRVCVLIPVYNTAKHLYAALESISDQTYHDFEMLVIDDGSSDGSLEILEQYAVNEQRMNLIKRENRGLIATRNELLGRSSGELIAWMDSDDVSHPERLHRQVGEFDKDAELVCVGSALEFIDPANLPISVKQFPQEYSSIRIEQKNGRGMQFATTMMLRSTAVDIGGFRMPFLMGEDFDFLLRLGEVGKLKNLPDVLFKYRRYFKSTSSKLSDRWPIYRDVILKLADERTMYGTDTLQRGENLVIEFPCENNVSHDDQVDTYYNLRIYQNSFKNKNYNTAFKYATAALLPNPLCLRTWKIIIRTLLYGGISN